MSAGENAAARLFDALKAAGFTAVGRGWGHVRVGWPGEPVPGRSRSMVLTLDDTAPEYAEMLAAAVETLRAEARRGEAARHALDLHRMEAGR